ncbi:GNAT family N-acetyltransferase [uncultured Hoeflea sp.]|uniref:GNAT family N-acetyltransferase n=1 Tax=uncultured Hoeflea sp. TaxID=538666 RepID=UPI0030D82B2B|tara:strand:- start:103 stop:654 length:552 start_codon:yes stop_codon:yes gene_type:complete
MVPTQDISEEWDTLPSSRETTHLTLTKPRLADVPALFEFLGDPEAMTHTHCDESQSECRRRIAVHEWKRRINGYAPWVIRKKNELKPIGWGGLYDDPFEPGWGIELGYYFHPGSWGQGYGTELAVAALEVADNELAVPLVTAFAHPENKASNKLLEKVGFRWQHYMPKMDRNLYIRQRPDLRI